MANEQNQKSVTLNTTGKSELFSLTNLTGLSVRTTISTNNIALQVAKTKNASADSDFRYVKTADGTELIYALDTNDDIQVIHPDAFMFRYFRFVIINDSRVAQTVTEEELEIYYSQST